MSKAANKAIPWSGVFPILLLATGNGLTRCKQKINHVVHVMVLLMIYLFTNLVTLSFTANTPILKTCQVVVVILNTLRIGANVKTVHVFASVMEDNLKLYGRLINNSSLYNDILRTKSYQLIGARKVWIQIQMIHFQYKFCEWWRRYS